MMWRAFNGVCQSNYGNFGACYLPPAGDLPSDVPLTVFAARPGLRIWKATNEGKVLSTMIYKDSITSGEPIIQTVNLPSRLEGPVANEQKQFGILLPFNEKFLATWHGPCVWVLDPDTGLLIGCHSNLGRVVHVCACGKELFILSQGEGHFIRRIVYETRVTSPSLEVQEIDLNNPYEVAQVQRTSSFSHFQDTDKLNKLFDGLVSNVKTQAKRIKKQIILKDGSEEIDSSDADHLASSPLYVSKSTVPQSSTTNGHASTASDGEKGDGKISSSDQKGESSLSDNETGSSRPGVSRGIVELRKQVDGQKAFESSGDFESSEKIQQTALSPSDRAGVKKDPSFKHLSTQQFPCDIVFEGTSKQKPRKKKLRSGSDNPSSDASLGDGTEPGGKTRTRKPSPPIMQQNSVLSTEVAGSDALLTAPNGMVISAKNELSYGIENLADGAAMRRPIIPTITGHVAVTSANDAGSSVASCDVTPQLSLHVGRKAPSSNSNTDLNVCANIESSSAGFETTSLSGDAVLDSISRQQDVAQASIGPHETLALDIGSPAPLLGAEVLVPSAPSVDGCRDNPVHSDSYVRSIVEGSQPEQLAFSSLDVDVNWEYPRGECCGADSKICGLAENELSPKIREQVQVHQDTSQSDSCVIDKDVASCSMINQLGISVPVNNITAPGFDRECEHPHLRSPTDSIGFPSPSYLSPEYSVDTFSSESAYEFDHSGDDANRSGEDLFMKTTIKESDIILGEDEDSLNFNDIRGRRSPGVLNGFVPSGDPPCECPTDRPREVSDTCDSHVIVILHRRQGSNASVHSTASAKHIRGEALEQVHTDQSLKPAKLGEDDSIVANLVADHVDVENQTVPDEREVPVPEPLPEPLPFPAPQLGSYTTIYSQERMSISEMSMHEFSVHEPALDEHKEEFVDELTYISDNSQEMPVVISSGEETDAEDNRSHSPPIEIETSELPSTLPIRPKRRYHRDRRSLPNSPSGSDSEHYRPSVSPKGVDAVEERLRLLADSWADFTGPTCGTAQSVALSDSLLWAVDQHDHVFFTPAVSKTNVWKKLDGRAQMIATNQQGTVVWCISRQKLSFFRTGVKETCPQGSDWLPFEKDMHYVCVDFDCVWFIKANGDVFVRTGVSMDKPAGTGWRTIKPSSDLVQISAFGGLVWGLDIYNHIQIFQGDISEDATLVVDYSANWSELAGITASYVSVGPKGVGWIIDRDYGVWFNQDISKEDPRGGKWYQLSLGEKVPHGLFSSVLSFFRGGNEPKMLIANDVSGVWILGKHGSIHVAYGHLLGTRWELSIPPQLSSSSCWTCVSAGGADMNRGFVWALQPNGQLFCFKSGEQGYNVHPPPKVILKYVSAGLRSLWALTSNQEVYVRLGISDTCPQGLKWSRVDMLSQGNRRLIDVSCGNKTVWAVDFEGHPWLQVGREERRSTSSLSPAWIGIEGCPLDGCKFVKIVVGPDDRIVWACDDKSNVYARKDVTEDFWIGNSWELVAGTSGKDLAISSSQVWALCPNGDVICRFGVSKNNVLGDYWKKVPGSFEHLSVSNNDELWGIDRQGQLYQRQTLLFYGSMLSKRAPSYSELFPADNDWELI